MISKGLGMLSIASLLSALCHSGRAQDVAWIATGAPDRDLRGWKLTGIGDINADGYEDMVCGVNLHCGLVANPTPAALWFLSGADGTRLRELFSYGPSVSFGAIAAAGDMNNDSVPDYVALQGSVTSVWCEVRSGASDAVLWSIPGSWLVLLSDLDLDGDGRRDLVVGNGSEVRAYRHGGALLYVLTTSPGFTTAGGPFAALGDVDDDGRDDFVMGVGEPSGRGAGAIVSGATGQYIRVCYGELPGDVIGLPSACGDLDRDGYSDFALSNGGGPATARGVVRVFSSRTGQPLWQWTDSQPLWGDGMASRGVDLDGDGFGDVVVGSRWDFFPAGGIQGAIYSFSGRDGSQLHRTIQPPPQAGQSGSLGNLWTTTLRARAGEKIGYIVSPTLIGPFGPGTTPFCGHNYGSIVAYRGLPRTAVTIGPTCPGNLATAPTIGMASLGPQGVRIHLSQAPPNTLAVLLLGLSTAQFGGVPLPLPLDVLGLPGCQLRTSIDLMCTTVAGAVGTASGYANVDVPVPVALVGTGTWNISAQWWALGDAATFPGGMSQAIRWSR